MDEKLSPSTALLDTVVVPAHEVGFRGVFLAENRWYEIQIAAEVLRHLKFIAVYRLAPVSAITHVARIKSIEPWQSSGKYVVNLAEPATEIEPIRLVRGGRIKPLQNRRYASSVKLRLAKTLDDLWKP